VAKIAHRFGCLSGQLCRLLWDTGCSHELITPLFAQKLISNGAKWEFLAAPSTIEHGNAAVVSSGAPVTTRVCLDVLIVHKSRIFQQKDVWFMVYDGCLPDAMLSDSLLNGIACMDEPGTSLIDTRARLNDLPILLQQMDDYQGLNQHRVNTARLAPPAANPSANAAQPHTASAAPATAAETTPPQTTAVDAAAAAFPPSPPAPPTAHESAAAHAEHDRIKRLLAEMAQQRADLMVRLGKPISDEAFAACWTATLTTSGHQGLMPADWASIALS
jgi:hypothetical protein